MRRIICSTVTETLMNALEHADEIDNLVIICWNKEGQVKTGQAFSDDGMTTAQCLMLVEQFKFWLMRNAMDGDDD